MRINIFIFFSIFYCFTQIQSNTYEFKFYKNGQYKDTKKIELFLVKNSDSIKCEIIKNRITIPKVNSIYSVVLLNKKKAYTIENVDFSKLDNDSKIVFGLEKDLRRFTQLSSEFPTTYFLNETGLSIKIEEKNLAKKVNFIVFNSRTKMSNEKFIVKNYSQSAIE